MSTNCIASGSMDNTVRIWNTETGALAYTLDGHTLSVFSLAVSSDGYVLFSGSADNTVRTWNVAQNFTSMSTMDMGSIVYNLVELNQRNAFFVCLLLYLCSFIVAKLYAST